VVVVALDPIRQGAFAARVDVALLVGRQGVALFLQDFQRLLHGDAREGHAGDDDLAAKQLFHRLAVAVFHRLPGILQPALLEGHHIFVRFDPRHLHIDAGELGHMARGEGRVGAEHRADLKNAVEAG